MFDLAGKKALVTGASGGIGEAIARALHRQGAEVGISVTRLDGSRLCDRAYAPRQRRNGNDLTAIFARKLSIANSDRVLANAGEVWYPRPGCLAGATGSAGGGGGGGRREAGP